ncbi:MAG: hypothetical protein WDM91_18505 [Rhizomicrobium sp.]
MGFVARHWRGGYSLARSFWVNGVVLFIPALALQLAALLLVRKLGLSGGADFVRALIVVSMVGFLFAFWQLVGIWNSASRTWRAGARFWPLVTYAVVLLIVALNVWYVAAKAVPDMRRLASGYHTVR